MAGDPEDMFSLKLLKNLNFKIRQRISSRKHAYIFLTPLNPTFI